MENSAAYFSELHDLLEALCEGMADERQLARIQEMTQDSPAAMQFYIDYLDQHARLLWRSRGLSSTVPAETRGELCDAALGQVDTAISSVETQADTPLLMSLGNAESNGFSPPASGFFSYWSSTRLAAAFLAVMIVAGVLIASSWFSRQQEVARDPAVPVAHGKVNSVRLDSGSVMLSLEKIGSVIVEGPAEFDFLGPMRARLTRGRIKMHVSEVTGRGFVVETPFGNVMDLGTEFGLEVYEQGQAGVVVFDGAVDLQVAESSDNPDFSRVERLVRGEGLAFTEDGQLHRIMSIITGSGATFQQQLSNGRPPVILQVTDNKQTSETKKFYEIVAGGLGEDAKAYVDRPHEWNGITSDGIPSYLVGADYVKTFNDNKVQKEIELQVTLSQPAKLYVFFDKRLKPPQWLQDGFRKTTDTIGLDVDRWSGSKLPANRGNGAGVSVDVRFGIWEKVVSQPSTIRLGANTKSSKSSSGMYGIAAVALTGAASSTEPQR